MEYMENKMDDLITGANLQQEESNSFKLIPMTDFVLNQNEIGMEVQSLTYQQSDRARRFYLISKYANFLKQPLTLGMFVPCDEDGNVLKEPKQWIGALEFAIGEDYEEAEKYQQAKESVLFEGFSISSNNLVFNEDITIEFCTKNIEVHNEFSQEYNVHIIEDLSNIDLILTENAIKKIGL